MSADKNPDSPILTEDELRTLWQFSQRMGHQLSRDQAKELIEHGLAAALRIRALEDEVKRLRGTP